MLIRFSVTNFKSFNEKQTLEMIPEKRTKSKLDHIMTINEVKLLKNATIYGANASGKTNIIEAINLSKDIITNKIPSESINHYCRCNSDNELKETTFDFELYKNGRYYAYGFSCLLNKQTITSEWLYELFPKNSSYKALFERHIDQNLFEIGKHISLNKFNKMRLEIYKNDFAQNHNSLFITEMNRNKTIEKDSPFIFFKDVFDWFNEDLIAIFPNQPITYFDHFYGNSTNKEISEIIQCFDTGISTIKIKEVSLNDFKTKVTPAKANEILETFNKKLEETQINQLAAMSVRSSNNFYNIQAKKGQEPIITTIILEHDHCDDSFEFNEESDGTRRLFDLIEILLNKDKNKIYVIDELERSLHPNLTYKFLELYFKKMKDQSTQIIFTTHESNILDQNLLRRDEVWFIEKNFKNISHLYSLARFNERFDKRLSKAYLEGRYGAIPIFKNYFLEEEL